MSKGSWYRPVNNKKYSENYDKVFGKPKKKPAIRDECAFGGTCVSNCDDCLIGEALEEINE